jgi:hypothetical protein
MQNESVSQEKEKRIDDIQVRVREESVSARTLSHVIFMRKEPGILYGGKGAEELVKRMIWNASRDAF